MVPLGVVVSKKGASEMGKKLISSTEERSIERREIFNGFWRHKCAGEILIGWRRRGKNNNNYLTL